MDNKLKVDLERLALEIRIGILEQLKSRGFGHAGGSLSAADLMAVLYGAEMRYDPANPSLETRDKFVCSKGHGGPAVYSALAVKGFFPYEVLTTLNRPKTTLPSHCDRLKTPGIDMTTGSLGQGTSIAVGMAFAKKVKKSEENVFLLVGDGECNEGQVWEAAMFAAAHGLDNLFWFIDYNKKQLDGYISEIQEAFDYCEKMKAFGFDARTVDGNNVEAIYDAIQEAKKNSGKPHAFVLDTVKGSGVPEIESMYMNHGVNVPMEKWVGWQDTLKQALADFSEKWGDA